MAEDPKDILLRRVQVTIAILAGLATLILGVYNVKKNVLSGGEGSLAVSVRAENGGPVGALIELYDAQNQLQESGEARGGSFSREGLESGSYILKTNARGFEPEVYTVKIAPKKKTTFEVVLRPIAGAPAAGDPIKSALQEAGASWIKKLGQAKNETVETTAQN